MLAGMVEVDNLAERGAKEDGLGPVFKCIIIRAAAMALEKFGAD